MKKERWAALLPLILLWLALIGSGCGFLIAQSLGLPPAEYSLKKTQTHMVPMRDGVRLATDVYLPKTDKRMPAILIRTPYNKGKGKNLIAKAFATRGYVVAVQDVRGRYGSEGRFYAFTNEREDGYDTFKWLRRQSWCNGKVALYGFSYYGYTTWRTADAAGDKLSCWAPGYIGSRIYDVAYRQGAYSLLTTANWSFGVGTRTSQNGMVYRPDAVFRGPLITLDNRAGRDISFFNDWARHPTFDDFWKPMSTEGRWKNVDAPALVVNGWYDFVQGSTLADWENLTTKAGKRARKESRLVMGPWSHGGPHKLTGINFGKQADFLSFNKYYFEWFGHYLHGDTDITLPRVRVFTMGVNRWQNFSAWPPPDAKKRSWYLHSGGQAQNMGDGRFSRSRPGQESYDRFTHDPQHLVPTTGGPIFGAPPGPADQSALGRRDDVLVYTSVELERDLEITGPVTASIWFAADTPDVDIAVSLLDVDPSGTARVIVDGIARASYRNGDAHDWLSRNKPVRMEIDLWSTSHVFAKGHRLRVHIAGSNYPRFMPNPCTKVEPYKAEQFAKAHIRLYHDAEHSSRLMLSER